MWCSTKFLGRIDIRALRLCIGRTAHRGSRGIALPFLDHGTKRDKRSVSRPGPSLPPGKTRYLLYRRLCGPQDRTGQVRKISSPPGFDPRTVQPVSSHNTDWATRPTYGESIWFYWQMYLIRNNIYPIYTQYIPNILLPNSFKILVTFNFYYYFSLSKFAIRMSLATSEPWICSLFT
jgi:hypothetical protein